MPKVDKSIETLQLSIDHVDARVKVLETEQPAGATTTPKANGHSSASQHQGTVSGAQRAPGPTLVRGKRHFAHSPIQFEFGEFSGKDDELDSSPFTDHRDEHRNHSRMPKTDFPKFAGDNPKWWKAVAEKYFSMYHVPRDTWARFATMHFIGI